MDRAIHLTSPRFREDIIQNINTILLENNYPQNFITKIIKQRLHKFYNSNKYTKNIDEQKSTKHLAIPFVNNLSQPLSKKFKQYNIKISHKNTHNLKFLYSKLKSKVPMTKQSNIIYQIPCKDCEAVYIGQTSQYLKERLNGHKYQKNITALKKHCQNNKHTFNFDDTTILDREQNKGVRNILESIYINNNTKACNNRTDINNLPKLYYPIIKNFHLTFDRNVRKRPLYIKF